MPGRIFEVIHLNYEVVQYQCRLPTYRRETRRISARISRQSCCAVAPAIVAELVTPAKTVENINIETNHTDQCGNHLVVLSGTDEKSTSVREGKLRLPERIPRGAI